MTTIPWPTTRASRPSRTASARGGRFDPGSSAFDAGEPRSREEGHDPDWLHDLKEDVTRSVFAIEKVADRVAAMRDDGRHLRTLAADLRRELDDERAEMGRRLADQDRTLARQQRRTQTAEACADSLADLLSVLEQQLTTCRAQTERLVDAVDHVVASEAERAASYF